MDRLWTAYRRWYAAGTAVAGYDRTDEAAALLRQAGVFATMDCPEQARASYTAVLERYPEPGLAGLRESASDALRTLPPAPAESQPGAPPPPPPLPENQPVVLHP
ncbi:hypothetical protein [Azospirillum sp. ST 5-10]|uniref:hypothetical protein n=1 Tax=unclassified Azospirillum TaxID=2630922 RepID=UPI003F4A2700